MNLSALQPLAKRVYRNLPRGWTAGLDLYQRRRHGGARPPARLDVMTSIGGNDLDVLQVMLQSLSESHPRDRIEFWLFYLHYGPEKLAEISEFCAGLPNLNLNLVPVGNRADFAQLSKLGGRPYGARFLWLVAHLHLPQDLKRIIYLDPLDTLVTDDLLPFLTQPLMGRYLAACREAPYSPPRLSPPAIKAHARGASADKILWVSRGVLNSGAIVINLDRFRRDGIGIGHYLKAGEWAKEEMDLSFGDQGLFSLTHGSNYVQAHDRYNYRFHDTPRKLRRTDAAVIHFAGRIAKPFHLRLTGDQEQEILDYLDRTGKGAFRLNANQTIKAYDLAFYRQWWEVCARTPVHDRIAPPAGAYATRVLAEGQMDDQTDERIGPAA